MSKNSKELAVKYHGDGKLPKRKKKNPNVAEVSKMGYRDDSPYKSMPYMDIHTPNGTIDMSATGIPLWANGRVLPPYSGMHQFDSKVVREIPLAETGGSLPKAQIGRNNYFQRSSEKPSWQDYMAVYNSAQNYKNWLLSNTPTVKDDWRSPKLNVLVGEYEKDLLGTKKEGEVYKEDDPFYFFLDKDVPVDPETGTRLGLPKFARLDDVVVTGYTGGIPQDHIMQHNQYDYWNTRRPENWLWIAEKRRQELERGFNPWTNKPIPGAPEMNSYFKPLNKHQFLQGDISPFVFETASLNEEGKLETKPGITMRPDDPAFGTYPRIPSNLGAPLQLFDTRIKPSRLVTTAKGSGKDWKNFIGIEKIKDSPYANPGGFPECPGCMSTGYYYDYDLPEDMPYITSNKAFDTNYVGQDNSDQPSGSYGSGTFYKYYPKGKKTDKPVFITADQYNAYKKQGMLEGQPEKRMGGPLPKKYQTGGQPNNFDFNDLFLTDEEVTANLGQLTERRRECVESGAEGCLGNANAYYNKFIAPKIGAPSSWDELKNAGAYSNKGNTYDSWDVHGLDNRVVLYNKNDKNQGSKSAEINWKELNLPIGAIVGFGEHGPNFGGTADKALNAKKGLPLAGHSGRVAGYDKNTGEPFVFDTVNGLKRISQNQYQPISVISVDNRIADNTYDKISSGELSYKGDYDDIQITFPKNLEHDPDEFIPFIDALTKNKSKYANALGMNTKEYNEFARRAAALSISETEGGNDFIFRSWNGIPVPSYILDQAGVTGSAGITQLNKDVLKTLFNDPSNERRFKSVFGDDMNYNWFQFNNPEHVAFATMLLLKQNKRAAQALNKRGKTNNPNFTDDDLAWYMWNQPSTILKGEAQGDNLNYKKYKNALDMISVGKPLKGKLASKKQGGSTSKLPSHLPEAYQKGGWLKRYQTGGALYSVPRPNVETPMTTRNSSPVTLPTIEVTAERFKRDDLNEFLNKALSSANNQTFAAVSTRAGMSPAQVKSYMDSEGPIARVWDPYTKEFKLKTSARLQQEKAERDTRGGTISPLKERSFLENVDRTINRIANFSMRPGDYGERQKEGFLDNFLNPVGIAMYATPYVGQAIGTYQTARTLTNPEQYVPRDTYGDVSIDPAQWASSIFNLGMDLTDMPGFKKVNKLMGNPLRPLDPRNLGLSASTLPSGMTMDMAKAVYEAKSVGAVEEAIERDLWNAGIIRRNEQMRKNNPGGTPTVPKNVSDFIINNGLEENAKYVLNELEKRGYSIDFNSPVFNDPDALIKTFDQATELLKGTSDKAKLMRAHLNDKKANKGLSALRTEIGKIRALKTDPRVHKQFSDDVNNGRKSAVAPEKLTVHLDDPALGYRIPIEVQLKPSHVSLDRTDPIGNTGIGLRSFIKDKEDFGYDSTDKPYDQLSYNLSKDGIASHMMFTAADLGTNPSNLTPEQLSRWQKARQFNSGQLMMAAMDMMPAKIVVTEPNMSLDSHKGLMNIGTKPNYKYVTVIDNKGLLNESNPHAELNSIFKGHADNRIIPLAWPNTMAKFSPNVEDYRKFRSVGFYAPDEALMGGLRTQNGLLESTNEMLNKQLEHGHISQQFYDDNVTMWFKDPNDPSKGLTTQAPKISYGDAEFLNMTENERKAWLPQKTSKHPFFANGEKGFNSDYYNNASESNVRHMFDDPRVAKMLADDMAQNGSNWMTERSVYSVVGNDDLLSKWNTTAGSGGMGNVTIKQPIPAFSKEYKKFGGEIGGKKLRKGGQNWLSKYK